MFRPRTSSALFAILVGISPVPASAAGSARACPGGAPVATFDVSARPAAGGGPSLPLNVLDVIRKNDTLVYEPVGAALKSNKHASVTLILIGDDATTPPAVLPAKPARRHAEWRASIRASSVGVVFGADGIDEKKLNVLLRDDPTAIDRLADYADQTSKVEALVQTLSKYEQSAPDSGSLQSVLNGFSSQYGVSMPPIDRSKPIEQQASALLRALTPALAPEAARPTLVQQSGSLAASVASLFFGPPAGLAIGGAALVGNLHASLFPPAEFQSAFTQPVASGGVALCTGTPPPRDGHARRQFVWMLRLPDVEPPAACRAQADALPAGWTGTVTLRCPSVAQLKALPHARDWRLVSDKTAIPVPATIASRDADAVLTLNLKQARVGPGRYRLAAMWDWTPLPIDGSIDVQPLTDLPGAAVQPPFEDRLVASSGTIDLPLAGADFEFVDRVAIAGAAKPADGAPVPFSFPKSSSNQRPRPLSASVDTNRLAPGRYVLELTQVNGARHDIPLVVHPPNPALAQLPLRVNVGESRQTVVLHGSGLERIQRMTSPGATWTLAPPGSDARGLTERQADVRLDGGTHAGDRLAVAMFVEGLHEPVDVRNAVEVVGPRPKIVRVRTSITDGLGVTLHPDELPADAPVSFAVETVGAGAHPVVQLACNQERVMALDVAASPKPANATLALLGPDTLFLSLGAGAVGRADCSLSATVTNDATGTSDLYALGRIVRLPRIETFSIGDDKIADSLYGGTLTGAGLETIEKTGWNSETGYPVRGIATPVPGRFGEQTLRIAVPWPPPAPHAPLYIWLRGEREGRLTSAKY